MTQQQPQGLHHQEHPREFRGIEELREEALTLIEEANRLFKMNIEELYGLTQRINRLQEKAEEAQR